MTTLLNTIGDKLAQGLTLGPDDATALWDTHDLIGLGMLADEARRRRHGTATTFVRVADVDVADLATAEIAAAAGEVRIHGSAEALRGALAPLRQFTSARGQVPVSVGRLEDLVETAGSSLGELLQGLRAAGVWAVASAAVDRLADPVAAVRAVREAGLEVARVVVQRPVAAGPWAVLSIVRDLQEETGAVRAFAPLAREQDAARPTTGYADVKIVALSRLCLDDVASIQVDWQRHGPKLAQVALLFGADDVDGVLPVDDTEAGRRRAPLAELLGNIKAASLSARERDGRFGVRNGDPVQGR